MSLMMENNGKILKQRNSLRSGINISIGLGLLIVTVMSGLIDGFGGTAVNILAVFLGYKLLKLILKVFRLLCSLSASVISIAMLILTISLLIS
jgi:hypothetical protein